MNGACMAKQDLCELLHTAVMEWRGRDWTVWRPRTQSQLLWTGRTLMTTLWVMAYTLAAGSPPRLMCTRSRDGSKWASRARSQLTKLTEDTPCAKMGKGLRHITHCSGSPLRATASLLDREPMVTCHSRTSSMQLQRSILGERQFLIMMASYLPWVLLLA